MHINLTKKRFTKSSLAIVNNKCSIMEISQSKKIFTFFYKLTDIMLYKTLY